MVGIWVEKVQELVEEKVLQLALEKVLKQEAGLQAEVVTEHM